MHIWVYVGVFVFGNYNVISKSCESVYVIVPDVLVHVYYVWLVMTVKGMLSQKWGNRFQYVQFVNNNNRPKKNNNNTIYNNSKCYTENSLYLLEGTRVRG